MTRYIFNRIALMLVTLFIIMTVTFMIIRLMPDNPAIAPGQDPAIIELMKAKYGYDKPLIEQYFIWWKNIITKWDWGTSVSLQKGVETYKIIQQKLPITMQLNIFSFFLSMPLGFLFGIIAALKKNKSIDYFITFWVIFFISVPSFVIAKFMQYFLAYKFGWFDITLATGTEFNAVMFRSMVLPILALSFGPIATLTRYSRAELTEVLTSDFMLLARTKGLTQRQATVRHALRNSLVPLVSIVIGNFIGILFGSIIIEHIFAIPGVGGVLLNSIRNNDHPLTMTVLVFYTIINLFAILLIDLSYGIIDPRIRMGGRK